MERPGVLRFVLLPQIILGEDLTHVLVQGYYFAASQAYSQKEVAEKTAKVLKKHNMLQSTTPMAVSLEVIDKSMLAWGIPHVGTYASAINSRTRADRARKELGYGSTSPVAQVAESLRSSLVMAMHLIPD